MDRRTWQDPHNYSRETGTERRALRGRGDRRRRNSALRIFFIPMGLLIHKLRTRSLVL